MAQTIPGGRYKVGDRYVDANGVEIKAPTKAEEQAATREAKEQRQAEQALAQQLADRDVLIAQLQAQLAASAPVTPPANTDTPPTKPNGEKGK